MQFIVANVALDQHHLHTPIGKVLWRQVRVGQQVTILLITSGQALGGFDQLTQSDLTIDQLLIVVAQVAQRIEGATDKTHLVQQDPRVHRQLQRRCCGCGDMQARRAGAIAVGGQVWRGQAAFDFIAIEKHWQRSGAQPACPRKTENRDGQRTHLTLHDPGRYKSTKTAPSSGSSVGGVRIVV
ncbi:hypothetical protein D9M71_341730 [compost metagenome]